MTIQLSHPAPGRPLTSPFGPRRHPITGRETFHRGDDFGGSFDVLAAGDGVVVVNGFEAGGYGYYVIVEHNIGGVPLRTLYAHGAHRSKLEVGHAVTVGDVIFRSGSTGLSTGNHLHFEVHERDQFARWRAVNPAPYFEAPDPLPAQIEEQDDDMLLLMINDGLGKYGPKGKKYWAVSGPGYWWVTDRQEVADPLSVRLGNATAANLTYQEWEAAKAASGR